MTSSGLCSQPWRGGEKSSTLWISSTRQYAVQPALPTQSQTIKALAHTSLAQLNRFSQASSSRLSTARARLFQLKSAQPKTNSQFNSFGQSEIKKKTSLTQCFKSSLQSWTWHSKPSRQQSISHHLHRPQIMFTRAILATRLHFTVCHSQIEPDSKQQQIVRAAAQSESFHTLIEFPFEVRSKPPNVL